MLIWNPGKLTKDGKALLAKAQAGKCAIQITKAIVGKWLIYFERGHLTENCAEDREADIPDLKQSYQYRFSTGAEDHNGEQHTDSRI